MSCFLLAALFHNALSTTLATWFFQAYTVSQWGKPFHYDSVSLEGSKLVVLKPRFEKGSIFSAEKLVLSFDFDWWKQHLNIGVAIDQPHWHLKTPIHSEVPSWEKLIPRKEKWIKTHPSFHVDKGLLTWSVADGSQHSLKFDLEGNSHDGGFIKLFFDPNDHENNYLTLQALSSAEEMEVSCNCQEVCCSSLMSFTQLFGMDLSPWSLTDGSVKGELRAFFPLAERPHLEGELIFDQLAFIQSATQLEGYVEQASLKVAKNQIAFKSAEQVPTIICQLDILKPASLNHSSPIDVWRLDQILGSIKLNGVETALIDLEAQGGNPAHLSHWNLQGIANLNAQRSLNLDLTLFCSSSDQPDSKVHLFLHQPKQGLKQAKIQLNQMAYRECGFLQTLLTPFLPVCREFELEQGVFDAIVEADISDHKIGVLHIKNFRAHHIKSKLHSWNAQCSFDQAWGTSKIHLGEADFWNALNLELHIENGEFFLDDLTPSLPLKGIQANLVIDEGHVEHSLVTLQLAGLKGILDFEWGNSKQLLTLKLDGTAQDLTELLPSVMQDGFRQHFENNRLTILANLKSRKQQFDLDGSLHIQRTGSEQRDEIHFGCELKKNDAESKSKLIPQGWFYAHKLPLEKFLSPFIFRNGKLKMSGEAEFKGTFDDRFLTIKYDAENLKIENDLLCIEVKQLLSTVPGQLLGFHTIDLETHLHHGTLPIQQGTYYAKTTDLLFQDIQGLVSFESDSISISPLAGYCEGVYFAGTLDLDYSDPQPGIFNLSIRCPTLSGKISQIQRLLTHLDSSALLNIIPLEGEISTKGDGLTMDFTFVPNDYDLQAEFHGMIFDGTIPFDSTDMSLKGIYMDIDYRHLDQLLEFSDIQGTLLVGKPRLVEEYPFTGSHIRIQNLENPNLSLDVSVRDDDKELFRLCCHSQDEDEGFKSIHIDSQLSHLSGVHPHQSQCLLKNWCGLESLEFKLKFDVGILFQDLQRFHKTGLFFFSPQIIDKLAQFSPFKGEGSFDLYYHPADGLFTYQIESSKIKQGVDQQEHFGLIQGRKQDKKWILDHLQWDDWNIYAELQQSEDHWKIPFLGLKAGSSLLLGLEGEINPDRGFLKAKVNLCDIDLAGLARWDEFRPFIDKWRPKGRLRSSGEIEWYFLSDDPMSSLKGEFQAEGSELAIREYPLQVVHPFQIDIQPNLGCCIRNVQFALFPNDSQAMAHMLQLDFHLNQNRFHCPQLDFKIPSTQLAAVGQKLHHHFPEVFTHSLNDVLVASKTEGDLSGIFSFDQSNFQRTMHLKLDDGQYCYKNRTIDLKDCEIEVNGNQLHLSTLSQHQRCFFQILGEASWPSLHQGHCTLIDLMPAHPSSTYHPLVLEWKNHPIHGFSLRSAHGDFSGCTIHLNAENTGIDSNERTVLQGEVAIDFNSLSHLFPVDASESIQKLKMGSLYNLKGLFWMKPELGNALLETIYFRGICESFDPILKGFQLEKLTADLQYAPGRLDVQDLEVNDSAGNIYAASLSVMIDPQTHQWTIFMPRLVVKNFRPFSLRDVDASSTQTAFKFRSLIVKRAEIENFYGELDDLRTWQGQGTMHFLNPSRKNINHPLLSIPAEIILRLGLDPKVLNPVTGTINFDLREDRFYFTRFKDVYSEGRGSKFYLADGPTPSWMDFEGNLSLQIRMKQYNLIFKIAELFTVSVQGNIKKPTYTLQKQNKNSNKGRMQALDDAE